MSLADMARRLKPVARRWDLPPLMLMTDTLRLPDPQPALTRLPRGSAVILRHYDAPDRAGLARRLAVQCRSAGVRLLIAGDGRLAAAVAADGLHLTETQIAHGRRTWRLWRRHGWLVTAAAHSPSAVRRAARAGVDAVLLSPVFATASHPGAPPLGAMLFARWVRHSPVPVYALGGVSSITAPRLAGSGAAGLATVGGLFARGDQSGSTSAR